MRQAKETMTMSLNFDLTNVKKRLGAEQFEIITTSLETRDKPEGERRWHLVTDTLIWHAMFCGLNGITEDNVDEWCFRLALLQKLDGPALRFGSDGRAVYITRKDVENHIGLRTNVTTETRKAWLARIFAPMPTQITLDSGASADGLAISAQEQVDLIQKEILAAKAANN